MDPCKQSSKIQSSIVSEDDVIPFCPYEPPYTSYVSGQNREKFCSDKGVILATAYWQKSIVPPSFTWLKEENIKAVNKLKMERNGIAVSPSPPPVQPEGTGIFGYETRRISQPPPKHPVENTTGTRKYTKSEHTTKKQKTSKTGVKKKV